MPAALFEVAGALPPQYESTENTLDTFYDERGQTAALQPAILRVNEAFIEGDIDIDEARLALDELAKQGIV